MNPALAAEGYFHPLWRPFPQVVQPCSKSLKMKWAEQAATAKPQCPRPGSPHSKKLKLLTCAAGTIGFRASTPKYCLWNQNGTPPHALALAAWRQAPGHGFHTLRNPFRCTRPGLPISPATGTAAPNARGQVHPTARSVSSWRALPIQLDSELQLLSTVCGTKTALLRTPSLWQPGGKHRGTPFRSCLARASEAGESNGRGKTPQVK
jgi:hypothetical protein